MYFIYHALSICEQSAKSDKNNQNQIKSIKADKINQGKFCKKGSF